MNLPFSEGAYGASTAPETVPEFSSTPNAGRPLRDVNSAERCRPTATSYAETDEIFRTHRSLELVP